MDQIIVGLTQAAVWTGSGIELRDMEIPTLESGEVLVRVDLATVCGSDLHTVSGRRHCACPSVLGHEAVGHVIAIGDAVSAVEVGDRIVWSVTVCCGRCARCVRGFTAKCSAVRKVGHESAESAWALSGSYARHIVLPRGTAVVRIPDTMPDAVAAPAACATATVMAALDAAGALDGRRVLIVGAGMLGVTAAAAARERGAAVSVIDRDLQRQRQSRAFGAVEDDGAHTDVAIDFSGSSSAVQAASGRLDVGGRLVLAGSVAPGAPITVDPEAVVRNWLTITGIHNYEPRHLHQAVAFLRDTGEKYPWESLVEAPVPLAELESVLRPTPSGILRSSVAPWAHGLSTRSNDCPARPAGVASR
ncbi:MULTISPECIES: zinc-binding dehydrogenase [unclassified Rhodococcus (in: high G+C Gram-positive bacteria)]|uniref:zinc-binding dehydrogenase n=1 Tax=unclassified Rhodococcus (in: high G+C Gram-positive bacteria) TaxID=192944 RepID=UPI000B9C7291|nr:MULTISPECIES: zinc-binding dehydrogenase [unclassified Rhodococcus (in: high G+C Gram-positive bacteria)]OZE43107.1 dehydrogenase [Rhodococcus sp. 05-2254-4]OZE43115.1 dehydrogenase [Rhodococcus sp. 05-2254-4]OZE47301.1 dehydrogenase [Rhodococcus sp. 05-2254-3]OZE47600.1 dehydrogenase [Rhodococcus sp. 05-2254-2]